MHKHVIEVIKEIEFFRILILLNTILCIYRIFHIPLSGSLKEAKEFDKLTPEESKKRLLVLIKLMDLNKDGFVERHELKAWILRSFK